MMYHCDGHCTIFFSLWCSPPAHRCRGYIDSVCMHRLRASTTLLLPGVMQWETVTGNHSSKSSLKDGCYFPVTEENQTHIHIQIQLNYLQIHAMFPYAFCSIIQRPLGFRNEMHLIGFYLKWQYRHIFHDYVKPLSFVDFLPKEWKACYLSTVSGRRCQQYW